MSLKKILVLDGVIAVCRFQDDGSIREGEGTMPPEMLQRLAQFAQWYRRMVSGNTDLFSLFSQMRGWTPAKGWIVHGNNITVCNMANLVAIIDNTEANVNQVMRAMEEASHQ
jgi:roadblock/LC7 domain-containing protein